MNDIQGLMDSTLDPAETKCPRCSGGGEVHSNTVPWRDKFPGMWSSCPDCKGTGRLSALDKGGKEK